MNNSRRNLILALLALILTIAMISITFDFRRQLGWWAFSDAFALFMTVFTWLMSLLIGRIIPHSGLMLKKAAIVFAVLFAVALVAEYAVYLYVGL